MPERLAADKKQKTQRAHTDLVNALQARAILLTKEEECNGEDYSTALIGGQRRMIREGVSISQPSSS